MNRVTAGVAETKRPAVGARAPREPGWRLGIDVGGTFTDLVAVEAVSGRISRLKVPSTADDRTIGVLDAVSAWRRRHREPIYSVTHASTVGTNVFRGQRSLQVPRVVLLTTAGFRDVLEIGRQRRPRLYDLSCTRPVPVVSRECRLGIQERMDAAGHSLRPVSAASVHRCARRIKELGAEVVVVALLHSYASDEHERQVRRMLKSKLPGMPIVISSEVNAEYREYERTSTAVVNGVLIPVVAAYLERLRRGLQASGISAPLWIMQSNGGLMNETEARQLPVATLESGPATGVIAGAYWGRLLKQSRVLTFDMGGTTAKAGVVVDGKPGMVDQYEVGGVVHHGRSVAGSGYAVRYPSVDLAEVSGGGGTIAWVNSTGSLQVGPTSAGADPGPACYGRDGTEPTVADAQLVLGRLNPAALCNGRFPLYPGRARYALEERIAGPLGISMERAAEGIVRLVEDHMMRALRLVSVERGHDPREFCMLAFGGSGPMHAAFLAEALGIQRVVVPFSAGVFSATGLLVTGFRQDRLRTVLRPMSRTTFQDLDDIFARLTTEAADIRADRNIDETSLVQEQFLSLRYRGQSHDLTIPLQNDGISTLEAFHRAHRAVYGYAVPEEAVEVVAARLIVRDPGQAAPLSGRLEADNADSRRDVETRRVFFGREGWMYTPVLWGPGCRRGCMIEGPAVVEYPETTCVVPPCWRGNVDSGHNLHLVGRGT